MSKACYIHIPFCEQICFYCDFNKFYLENQPVDEYIESLILEMSFSHRDATEPLKSIYIGGGTPTALSAEQLNRLLIGVKQNLPIGQVKEFTVEVNPDNATKERLKVLKKHGVNRLSIGVQSFDEHLLKEIGRTHDEENIYRAIENCREIGFDNISLDLMFGLPHQTIEQFRQSVAKAIALDVEHVSAYSLKIEEKTIFFNRQRKGQLTLPPENDEIVMYKFLCEEMRKNGLRQYEISNFAKPGFESNHNLVYWNNEEYEAYGAGAHGYINGYRFQNHGPLNKYLESIRNGKLPRLLEHKVTVVEQIEEEMFLGLRKRIGLNDRNFQQKYGYKMRELFDAQIEDLRKRNLIEEEDGNIRLTENGLLLANEVFEAFLAVLDESKLSLRE
ncbi:coproporphyrinogen III oxidase [Bacillus sp. TS-2]|nr:coproporphyrinogen III oxidase [Bacillus sp. TS-2]